MSKSILLIDDDTLVRQSLGDTLTTAGYQVSTAEDGQDGLVKALATHPDLIISDVRMPNVDGLQMLDKLRADEWGKTVPVIILSSDNTTISINQALANGVTLYLSKTLLSPDQITAEIKKTL
jgi:CheY-like chemotaxis protein